GLRHHADERDADARASTRGAEAAVAGADPVPAHAAVPQGREEMKRHDGSVIIVTGAAGAIGFATCEILAREGASLLLVDIDGEGLQRRLKELAPQNRGGSAQSFLTHAADVSDEEATKGYVQAAI